jgi:hypothetical protein
MDRVCAGDAPGSMTLPGHARQDRGRRSAIRLANTIRVRGNNEYEVDGICLGGRPRLDGGQLFTYLARVRTREFPMLLARALLGRVRQSGAFEIVSAPELWIDTPNARHVRIALEARLRR